MGTGLPIRTQRPLILADPTAMAGRVPVTVPGPMHIVPLMTRLNAVPAATFVAMTLIVASFTPGKRIAGRTTMPCGSSPAAPEQLAPCRPQPRGLDDDLGIILAGNHQFLARRRALERV